MDFIFLGELFDGGSGAQRCEINGRSFLLLGVCSLFIVHFVGEFLFLGVGMVCYEVY